MSPQNKSMLPEGIARVHVLRYQCAHCRRTFSQKPKAVAHLPRCFKREDRTPWPGELIAFFPEDENPEWWPRDEKGEPREGCIFDGKEWRDVPGFNPKMDEEHWPILQGQALHRFHAYQRLGVLWPELDEFEAEAFQ